MSEIYDIEEIPDGMSPLSFNLINHYQREDPLLTEKLKCAEYKKGYFCGGRNTIELVTYEGRILIPHKIKKYVVKWYHTYLLHPGLDRTEAKIRQHLYWTGIKESVQKEVTKCAICQRTKRSTKKYGKIPAKLAE